MVEYQCKKCSKKFARKFLYDQHSRRKTDCTHNGSKTNKIMKFKCNSCKKNFSRKDSLKRHYLVCKEKNKTITKCSKNIKTNGIDNIINTGKGSIIASGNSNIFKNSKVKIVNLIVFSKDGIENISANDLAEIFSTEKNFLESIISNVNLNPKKPQHHNIYYGDTKSSYGEVYEGNAWVRKKIDEILEILIQAKIEDLNKILTSLSPLLNKKTRNEIKKTIENFDYTKPNARKKLKTYLKPILYNHKNMINKTKMMTT